MKAQEIPKYQLQWKIHTANLLKEVLESNPGMGIMKIPFNMLKDILREVGERASELNDPILNALMCRLTIYEIADRSSKEYDPEMVDKILKKAWEMKNN